MSETHDTLAEEIRNRTGALGVIVLVAVEGDDSPGFSVHGCEDFLLAAPDLLRQIADSIEKGHASIAEGGST